MDQRKRSSMQTAARDWRRDDPPRASRTSVAFAAELNATGTRRVGMAQKPRIVPIPAKDKVAYIDDTIKAIDLELTAADIEDINAKTAQIPAQGGRLDGDLLSIYE